MTVLEVRGVPGLPEVAAGDDLAVLLTAALDAAGTPLADGDVVVVSSKVVAKAQGRLVAAADRDACVTAETVRVVAERTTPRGTARVVQSRSGPVLVAAGVDASNVPGGTVLPLPRDPDGAARALRAGLAARTGRRVAVVLSDTLGRPWREGQADAAVGAAGLVVADDLRGVPDTGGVVMEVTVRAVADEVAAAADLVKGKVAGVPAAVVRGLAAFVTDDDGPGAAALLRAAGADWFRLGHVEAVRSALGVPPPPDPADAAVPPRSVLPEPLEVRAARALALALGPRTVAAGAAVTADRTGGTVVLRGDDPVALGAVAERLAVAAWSEDLAATCVRDGAALVVALA